MSGNPLSGRGSKEASERSSLGARVQASLKEQGIMPLTVEEAKQRAALAGDAARILTHLEDSLHGGSEAKKS